MMFHCWRHVRTIGPLAMVLLLSVTAACTDGLEAGWRGAVTPAPAPTWDPLSIMVSPANGATGVSPVDPVTVRVSHGTLAGVTLTGAQGKSVAGRLDRAARNWSGTERLGYNKTYTLKVTAVGDDGGRREETRTFTTVKPKSYTVPYLRANAITPLDGGTYGVGQPIMVWFSQAPTNRAAAERALVVTTDPPVVGAWRWVDGHELHWRPKVYWPAGTRVKVEANVYGRDLGHGMYGKQNVSASFRIGRSKIAIADAATFRMKVYLDGQPVTTINGHDISNGIPISMGKGGTEIGANGQVVDYWTRSGPHLVMEKYEVYKMSSASFGITDPNSPNYYPPTDIKKSIRISYAGEFVHLADWNIPQQGVQNTSHGCINVAPAYIYWFYDTFSTGDIVDVRNTPKQLDDQNGNGPADWNIPWDRWRKGL
jgi:lipoprotein-anchoring transpeptidase ErfK/SrfK